MTGTPHLLTTRQVAALLDVNIRTVQRLVTSGTLAPAMRVNDGPRAAFLFHEGDVVRYLEWRSTAEKGVAS